MMMPANYSVIAENEMTYVVGGGLVETLGKYTAPIWDDSNIKTFNTNLVTIIGNSYVNKFVTGTLGVIFTGNASKKDVFNIPKTLFTTQLDGKTAITKGHIGDYVANALGLTAAVYTMGRANVKSVVDGATVKISG